MQVCAGRCLVQHGAGVEYVCMSKDVSAEIGFTFDAVLEAVQDSSRGRWFLEEFKKREGQADQARLVDAISRIELRVEGMSGHFTAAEDLAKVRQAIAKTRSDIVGLQPETKGLSEEGKLFAHLADLARKAMPEQSRQTGIEQALRLVDQIDSSLNSNVTAFPTIAAKPADKYFQQDAVVFEQKPTVAVPGPKLVVTPEPASKPEPIATGAKLSITRVGQTKVEDTKPEVVIEVKAEAVPEPQAATPEPAKPRIVIIRRKPEELTDLPAASTAA